jgi:hypothetical protein
MAGLLLILCPAEEGLDATRTAPLSRAAVRPFGSTLLTNFSAAPRICGHLDLQLALSGLHLAWPVPPHLPRPLIPCRREWAMPSIARVKSLVSKPW